MPRKPKRRTYGDGTVTRRPTGRYQAQLYLIDGQRLSRTFDTERQAEEWLTRQNARKLDGKLERPPPDISTGELLDWWLETYCANIPPATHASYAWAAKQLAAPLRAVPVPRLRVGRVQQLVNAMHATGKSLSTIRILRVVLRQAFAAGVINSMAALIPTDGLRLPEEVWTERSVWNAEQAAAFLALASQDDLALFWLLLFATGMRQGEVRGLRWEAVDFAAGFLHVRYNLSGDGRLLAMTKNRRRRTLRPDAELLAVLRDRWTEAGEPPSGYIFTGSKGQPYPGHAIHHRFLKLVDAAGLPRLTPHGARHTCASVLRSQGADLKDIQEILGHSSIAITANIYQHNPPERQATTLHRMADALRKRAAKTD